jgi:hypothetical protein
MYVCVYIYLFTSMRTRCKNLVRCGCKCIMHVITSVLEMSWSRDLLQENNRSADQRKLSLFIKLEGPLHFSQTPSTGIYTEPDKSTPPTHTHFFKITLTPKSPNVPSDLPLKTLHTFLVSPIRATSPNQKFISLHCISSVNLSSTLSEILKLHTYIHTHIHTYVNTYIHKYTSG